MRVFISTAERSGELYAALIADDLRMNYSNVEILGFRDKECELAPVGFGAGVASASNVMVKMGSIEREVRRLRPDVFLAVAWSEPNTILGLRLRDIRGMKRVFFAPPQLWAWGRWRSGLLRRGYDALYCLYPKEARFLRSLNLPAYFRGNPLVRHLRPYFKSKRDRNLIALLPGSRSCEKSRHINLLTQFRRRWLSLYPSSKAVWLFLTSEEAREATLPLEYGDGAVGGESRYAELARAGLAVVTSGTASLEAALLGTPQAVFYTMPGFEVALARTLTHVRHFALPNIILGERRVPELLNPSVESLLEAALNLSREEGRKLATRLRTELSAPIDKPPFPLSML
ncbi:hypothetical protein JXM67_00155 [candidate division WOR-3 bacterium]|nr:hypothetical protein [candidate division WOR-3 bacterium]